ncbi:MAG: type II toxin-antitoxin system RelB/DinJ family antitoxin [Oscillospiraceae bacterium]|jgi:DNA-damage-inducible protein J|nr:type II toxin-antitoxin system RelB/DinJ family antitoxin [Oscillospiraceae bacterium]
MANVNIRIDETLKQKAESIFSELGLSMTTATTAFYKQVVRVGGIPFELKLDPFYSEVNQKFVQDSIAQLERGEGKTFDDVNQVLAERP